MNDELKGVSLVVLGIVALLALVGLVLLFTKASATGNVPKGDGRMDGREFTEQRAARGYGLPGATYVVAGNRVGPEQEPQPRYFNERKRSLDDPESERIITGSQSPRAKLLNVYSEEE